MGRPLSHRILLANDKVAPPPYGPAFKNHCWGKASSIQEKYSDTHLRRPHALNSSLQAEPQAAVGLLDALHLLEDEEKFRASRKKEEAGRLASYEELWKMGFNKITVKYSVIVLGCEVGI